MPDYSFPVNSKSSIFWRKSPQAIKKYSFVYHFLPHPQDMRRATLLSNPSIFVYCALVVAVSIFFRVLPRVFPGVLGYASDISVRSLLEYTNQEREALGLSSLRINEDLSAAAAQKAQHMFQNGYWAHVAPDGTKPWDFILKNDYDYVYAGENLAKNFSNSRSVVEAWMASPSHRENMVNPKYVDIGFGVANGVLDGYETTLVVQMFGAPRNPTVVGTKTEEEIVTEIDEPVMVKSPSVSTGYSITPAVSSYADIKEVSKIVTGVIMLFVVCLLVIDIWYSRKKAIVKLTGSSLAHMIVLLAAFISISLMLSPGVVM